jgi:hypothetical protein
MKTLVFRLLAILCAGSALAQSPTYRILDAETAEPIPYATISIGEGRGTITNEEGYFTLAPGTLQNGQIQLSCMGYQSLEVRAGELGASRVFRLVPAAIQLNEVLLSDRVPTAEEIIRKVRENLPVNYAASNTPFSIFFRESEYMDFESLEMELEKASDLDRPQLEAARRELRELSTDIEESQAVKFLDFNGTFLRDGDSSLLRVEKATELVDAKRDFSLEEIQERGRRIILTHLDSSQTYKVKTGMFTLEKDLSPELDMEDSPESDSTETSHLKSELGDLLSIAGLEEGGRLFGFLDPVSYKYEFLKATYFDGNYIFAVRFAPKKRKARYVGTLYVDAATFAVLKTDYQFARGREGQKVNLRLLLGIKYVENLDRGTVIFRKSESGYYLPYYIQKEYGNYIYLLRDFTFIENSPSRKKVRFDFLLEGGVRQKQSLLLTPQDLQETAGSLADLPGKVWVQKLKSYQPTIWQNTEIIAPLEEMKNFKVTN